MLNKTRIIQPKVKEDLERVINENRLSRSILFNGIRYTGKLTAALECAKEILKVQNLYKSIPNIYLSLSRPYIVDMHAKAILYKKYLNNTSFINFLDSFLIVILSQSFASIREESGTKSTLDNESTTELINIFDTLINTSDIYEKSAEIIPLVDKVVSIVDKIKASSGFSIKDVRAFKTTSELHSIVGNGRIYIVEGLENAGSSAKNAFLKLLEEPPENSYFFILSENKERLGETILSRLSPFAFSPLSVKAKNDVISSYNEDGRKYSSLEDFFLTIGFEESKDIKAKAEEFTKYTIVEKNIDKSRDIVLTLFGKGKDSTVKSPYLMKIFTNEILIKSRSILIHKDDNVFYLKRLMEALTSAETRVQIYNQTLRNSALILMDDLLKL